MDILSKYTWTFSKTDHTLGHKASLSKFKKIEIISSIFSNNNTVRLEINYKEKKLQKTLTGGAKQYATKQEMDH